MSSFRRATHVRRAAHFLARDWRQCWCAMPRRHRRAHARMLHRSRTLPTAWADQWAVTRDSGKVCRAALAADRD